MYKYRLAETRDLDSLMVMSKKFYDSSAHTVVVPYDEDTVTLSMLNMIEDGLVVVTYPSDGEEGVEDPIEEQQPIVGAIAGSYFQSDINMHVKCLKERMFWLDEDHRETMAARTMMLVFQIGAKADDVQFMYMSSLPTSPDSVEYLYAKMGYAPAEKAFIKEL